MRHAAQTTTTINRIRHRRSITSVRARWQVIFISLVMVIVASTPPPVFSQSASQEMKSNEGSNEFVAIAKSGIQKAARHEHEQAILDFDKAIALMAAPIPNEGKKDGTDPRSVAKVVIFDARARSYFHLRKFEASKADSDAAINQLVSSGQNHPGVYGQRASCQEKLGNYEAAIEDHKTEIKAFPDKPNGYLAFAYLLASCPRYRFRDGRKAVELSKKAIAIASDRNQAHFYQALGFYEQNDLESATRSLGELTGDGFYVKHASKWRRTMFKGVFSGNAINPSNFKDNEDFLTEKIQNNPRDASAVYRRAQLYSTHDAKATARDYQRAIELELLPLSFRANAHVFLGLLSADMLMTPEQVDPSKAIKSFTKAIELHPQFSDAYSGRGFAYYQSGQYAKANSDFEKAVKIDPDNPDAYRYMARLLSCCPDDRFRNGKLAIEVATHSVKLYGSFNPLASLNAATAYAEAGQFEEAISICSSISDIVKKGRLFEISQSMKKQFENRQPIRDQPVKSK